MQDRGAVLPHQAHQHAGGGVAERGAAAHARGQAQAVDGGAPRGRLLLVALQRTERRGAAQLSLSLLAKRSCVDERHYC